MKIIRKYPKAELDVYNAVEDKLTPSAYSYDGQLERLNECINLQREMISRLISFLIDNKAVTKEQLLSELLGYGYIVEED